MEVICVCSQGMAFSLEERLQLGTHGLLPPCFITQEVQLLRVLKNYDMKKDDLDRWGLRTSTSVANIFLSVISSESAEQNLS